MYVESGHLAADRGAVSIAGPMQILVAVAALERLHSGHPKVIRISAEDVDSLTEPKLDFESVCVEHEDLEWGKGEVGGKQEDGTAMGMAYDDEAHDACRRAPHQIQAAVAQDDAIFTIDGTGG